MMTSRGLLIGACSVLFALTVSAASDDALAAKAKKVPAVCIARPPPLCPPFQHAVCTRKAGCGCLIWACRPFGPFPPPPGR
jgi:hypothetical protein